MTTMKIIDTCTLINIFERIDVDLDHCLKDYNLVTTDQVVAEYTRKIPRKIPQCLSVIGLKENDKALMEEIEFLFPRLGIGERSVFVMALGLASSVEKIVILSDDVKAVKGLSSIVKGEMHKKFPGSENIVWGNTLSMIDKFEKCGKLSPESTNKIHKTLN